MRPVAEALRGFGEPRTLEMPGHGLTPRGEAPFSISGFADWLAAEVGDSHPLVFGYSMGGYVALALEARRPGTFLGIATLGTKFAWTSEVARREASRLDPAIIRTKVPRFADALASRHAVAGGWERVVTDTASLLIGLGAAPPLAAAALGSVRARVVLGVGQSDDTVDEVETRRFAAMIPGGEAVVVAGAPHPIERVAPADVAELVRRVSA
jgi:pimeloyl-ACP methyl ester carboxylesterase